MAFTVEEVIQATRDLNPAFTPTRHPNALCRRFLTRYQRTLVNRIAEVAPRALPATLTSTALPLASFAAGITIPGDSVLLPDIAVRPATRNVDEARVPVELLPASTRYTNTTQLPWVWREGQTLYLAGSASQWTAFDLFEFRTVGIPATLASDGTALPLPDDALDCCAAQLGGFLAKRTAGSEDGPKFDPRTLVADAAEAESAFLMRLTNQQRAIVWSIRRVRD